MLILQSSILGGVRLDDSLLWHEYKIKKQTYAQLVEDYSCSLKTIKRHLDRYEPTSAIRVNTVVSDTMNRPKSICPGRMFNTRPTGLRQLFQTL
ncbi:hypothetical protein AGMMS50229_15480 [Campylobacterota bacterium]|nr:hypothetical protein AGMMS50229_15480 [Campylobacterota bacterium]